MSISEKIGQGGTWILNRIVHALVRAGVSPNFLTFFGLTINVLAAFAFGYGRFYLGGWIILAASVFDMLDGRVARESNRVSKFGAFYDSVIDRYSDIALYLGLLVYYYHIQSLRFVVITGLVIVGSVMTSYARARAESLIPLCKVGFMERPERIVLLILGGLFDCMPQALWVILVFSHLTVVSRIYYTRQQLRAAGDPK
ncbi:MAG: CDP-alcohol phosphatidyltransferase family protein [Acidobacteriota bacterium]